MGFDVRPLSTRLSEFDGIPRILGVIASLETRKLALRPPSTRARATPGTQSSTF